MIEQLTDPRLIRVVSKGIDWLTVTADGKEGSTLLMELFHVVSRETYGPDDFPEDWHFQGYKGTAFPSVKCGVRATDEAILILSGQSANVWAMALESQPVKVTRMDIQVTVRLAEHNPDLAHWAYKSLAAAREGKESAGHLRFISSMTGDTLYVGSRRSSTMLRFYDKGKDIPNAKRGSYWRYEVEYKKGKAKTAYDRFLGAEIKEEWVGAQVFEEFNVRGLWPTFKPEASVIAVEEGIRVTSLGGKISWLSRCVSPVITQLLALGHDEAVITALKLSHIIPRKEV